VSEDATWLLRRIAHDIRGATAVVTGSLNEVTRAPADATYYSMAERGVARLGRLADLISEVAHVRKTGIVITPTTTNLRPVVARAYERATTLIPSRKVKATLSEGADAALSFDEQHVFLALVEVVINALRFAKTKVELSIEVRSGGVTIVVSDDGPGFPEGHKIHYPWEGEVDGSGLGLAYARDVAKAHGGELFASTHATGGGQVELHLPAAAA
jgi:signal transduction histidine kinase